MSTAVDPRRGRTPGARHLSRSTATAAWNARDRPDHANAAPGRPRHPVYPPLSGPPPWPLHTPAAAVAPAARNRHTPPSAFRIGLAAAGELNPGPADQLPAVRGAHGPGRPATSARAGRWMSSTRTGCAPTACGSAARRQHAARRGAPGHEPARPGGFQGAPAAQAPGLRAFSRHVCPRRAGCGPGDCHRRVVALREVRASGLCRPDRVVVLPNGVDPAAGAALVTPARQAAMRARFDLAPAPLSGSGWPAWRRTRACPFSDALAVADCAQPWRWVIVGSGRDRAALGARRRRAGWPSAWLRGRGRRGRSAQPVRPGQGFAVQPLRGQLSWRRWRRWRTGCRWSPPRAAGCPTRCCPAAGPAGAARRCAGPGGGAGGAHGRSGAGGGLGPRRRGPRAERFTWAAIAAQTFACSRS